MSQVVHLKRSGGVVVQDCDVYIGRSCNMGGWNLRQSKWANPFTVKKEGSVTAAVKKYEGYIKSNPKLLADIEELRGKTLGCWCAPGPCHGDVLVALLDSATANGVAGATLKPGDGVPSDNPRSGLSASDNPN